MSTNKDDYNHLGLTDSEVLQSREKNGINLLTPPKRPSLWKLYLEKFEDPVVRVLLVAAVFSLIISIIENEYAETIGIIAAILLATGIGFFFEYDANKKFDLLNAVNEETLVKVIRNGRVQEVPRKDIVVGDIVILETGELKDLETIFYASLISAYAGADFIKTSTGKVPVNATPESAYVMCEAIKAYYGQTGKRVGLKVAGGVSKAQNAIRYLTIVNYVLGSEWLTPYYFRIGASQLMDDIVKEIKALQIAK